MVPADKSRTSHPTQRRFYGTRREKVYVEPSYCHDEGREGSGGSSIIVRKGGSNALGLWQRKLQWNRTKCSHLLLASCPHANQQVRDRSTTVFLDWPLDSLRLSRLPRAVHVPSSTPGGFL